MFTIRKGHVIQRGKRENRQTFRRQLTLGDLRIVLQVVCDGLGGYSMWPVCLACPKFPKLVL